MTETRETNGRDERVSLGPSFKITGPESIGGPRKEPSRKKSHPLEWWSERIPTLHKEGDQFAGECPAHEDMSLDSLKITPHDRPVMTLVNCQAGCEYDDIEAAAREIEPGTLPKKSPVITKKKKAETKKLIIKAESPSDDGRPPEPEPESEPDKKTGAVKITYKDDSGEEISNDLPAVAKWWEKYTGIPWSEWESWGARARADRIEFTWPGVNVVKCRPRGGSTSDIRWEPAKSNAPSLWPLPGDDLPEQIWLGEGESSTGVLRHLGFEAYSITKGANTELRLVELNRLYERGARDVRIGFDTDEAGADNAYRMKVQIDASPLNAYLIDLNDELDPFRGESDLRDLWLNVRDKEVMIDKLKALALQLSIAARSVAIVSTKELHEMDLPPTRFVIEDLLVEGLTLFGGKSGTGKSYLLLDALRCIASGEDFLGLKTIQKKCLYIALEDNLVRMKRRQTQQGHPPDIPLDIIVQKGFIDQIGYLNRGGLSIVEEWIKKFEYEVVGIDTLSRAIYGDQDRVNIMTPALAALQEMAQRLNIDIVMVDHHKKDSPELSTYEAIIHLLGSTAKGAVSDSIWGLYAPKEMMSQRLLVTGRDLEPRTFDIIQDKATFRWSQGTGINFSRVSKRKQEVVAALENIGRGRVADIAREVKNVRDDDVEVNVGSVHNILTELQLAGMVLQQIQGSKNEKWYSLRE